jgi:hypothetical protein
MLHPVATGEAELGKESRPTHPEPDFSYHIPTLAQASHDITLGIYWRLSRQYKKEDLEVDPCTLAYAVVYGLTQNEGGLRELEDFPFEHSELIEARAREALRDPEIYRAVSLECAGKLMAVAWVNQDPLSEEGQEISERASDLGIIIENIVAEWGTKAIVNLAEFARKFRKESL